MVSSALNDIERRLDELSDREQLLLIQRIAQRLSGRREATASALDKQLDEMAADPEIQREIREIDEEFAVTESDGLENL